MQELDDEIIAYFEHIGSLQGMDEATNKIFATIYISPEEVTMEQIAKKTKYSLASISNKIRLLEQAGIITRTCKPGSKKIYIHMEKNFINMIKKHLMKKEQIIIEFAKERIPAIIKKYEAKTKTESDKQKIALLQNYNKQIQKVEKMIPKMLQIIEKESEAN